MEKINSRVAIDENGREVPPIPLGIYRHFKGNLYEVTGFALHSETTEDMVIYKALYGERRTWVRSLTMWEEPVKLGERVVRRFELEDGE